MTTLKEIQKYYKVYSKFPSLKEIKVQSASLARGFDFKGERYWILITPSQGSEILDFLLSDRSYKAKEELFGVVDATSAYSMSEDEAPKYIQLTLPDHWDIEDGNTKRELQVTITNIHQENNPLLHELHSKTRH